MSIASNISQLNIGNSSVNTSLNNALTFQTNTTSNGIFNSSSITFNTNGSVFSYGNSTYECLVNSTSNNISTPSSVTISTNSTANVILTQASLTFNTNSSVSSTINALSFVATNTANQGVISLPGGWKINFGKVVTNSSGANTVTFTTSFINPPMSVITTTVSNSSVFADSWANAIANTGFVIFSGTQSTNVTSFTNTGILEVFYQAVGL